MDAAELLTTNMSLLCRPILSLLELSLEPHLHIHLHPITTPPSPTHLPQAKARVQSTKAAWEQLERKVHGKHAHHSANPEDKVS